MSSTNAKETATSALWLGGLAAVLILPSWLIYKALKRKGSNNALPIAAAVALPLGYFYLEDRRKEARARNVKAAEP
jgi:hypothetical protein